MMNKRMAVMRIIIIILLGVIIFLGSIIFLIFGPRMVINNKLNTMQIEASAQPAYVAYNTLYWEDKEISFSEFVRQNIGKAYFKEILVIRGDRIWFIYVKDDDRQTAGELWYLASVDQNGSDLQNHFCGEFGAAENASINVWEGNPACRELYYEEKNAFYISDKIIMQDGVKLIEYNMETGAVTEKEASQFVFPEEPIIVEIENRKEICFKQGGTEKHFTTDDGKKQSSAFGIMMTLEKKKTAMGTGFLEYLFHNVQFVGNEIYIICEVLNWHGETYALLYQYDFETNSCRYVGNHFMNDIVGRDMYLVEIVDE